MIVPDHEVWYVHKGPCIWPMRQQECKRRKSDFFSWVKGVVFLVKISACVLINKKLPQVSFNRYKDLRSHFVRMDRSEKK